MRRRQHVSAGVTPNWINYRVWLNGKEVTHLVVEASTPRGWVIVHIGDGIFERRHGMVRICESLRQR